MENEVKKTHPILNKPLYIMKLNLDTVVSQSDADLNYRFRTRILFFATLEAAEIRLIQMRVLAYLITGYAGLRQKCRKDFREVSCIKPHNQLSSAKELIGTRLTPLNGEAV